MPVGKKRVSDPRLFYWQENYSWLFIQLLLATLTLKQKHQRHDNTALFLEHMHDRAGRLGHPFRNHPQLFATLVNIAMAWTHPEQQNCDQAFCFNEAPHHDHAKRY
jgi:hypothetical protein